MVIFKDLHCKDFASVATWVMWRALHALYVTVLCWKITTLEIKGGARAP